MAYTIKIKNDSGSVQTWAGKEFAIAEEYTVPTDNNRIKYQTSSELITSIGAEDALIGDGVEYFTDVNKAIDWLKGNDTTPKDNDGSPIQRARAFANADNLRFRGTGVSGTMVKNTTTNLDYKMTEDRFINGMEVICKDHVHGDKMNFEVVDVDNILGYGAGTVLDQFGKDWYVAEDSHRHGPFILPYPALVNNGLYLRVAYISSGTVTDVDFKVNYFLHKK